MAQTPATPAAPEGSALGQAQNLLANIGKSVFNSPGTFYFEKKNISTLEDAKQFDIKVMRDPNSGRDAAIVHYMTIDDTAIGGTDYQRVTRGKVKFAAGEMSKNITLMVYDNAGVNEAKLFSVRIKSVDHGHVKDEESRVVNIKILDNDYLILNEIYYSSIFQALSTIFTFYALFGTDIFLVSCPKTVDEPVGIVTVVCICFFFVEICITSYVKKWAYFLTVMFWMDVIAMLALIPSVPAAAVAMASLSGASSTGTIARAGRAAQAGSRAGRTVKLPKLLGKIGECFAALGIAVLDEKKKQDAKKEAAEEEKKKKEEEAEAAAAKSGVDPENPMLKRSRTMSTIAREKAQKEVKEALDQSIPQPSKMGGLALELFTGKVIVMMMLLLVSFVLLFPSASPEQKRLGLDTLEQIALTDGGFESSAFKSALAVYVKGSESSAGSHFNTKETLIYLKINGDLVPRLVHGTTEYATSPEGAYLYYYNDESELDDRREVELGFASACSASLGDIVDNLTSDNCPTAVIFDNHSNIHDEARANMYLTVIIVAILAAGMGLIASDMQRLILDPIERLTRITKVLTNFFDPPEKEEEEKKDPLTPIQNVYNIYKRFTTNVKTVDEYFPVDSPLKIVFEVVDDIEQTFSITMHGTRRRLQQTENALKVAIDALRNIVKHLDKGTLTNSTLKYEMQRICDDIEDFWATFDFEDEPIFEVLSALFPIIQRSCGKVSDTMDSVLTGQAKAMGFQVTDQKPLNTGVLYQMVLVYARLWMRFAFYSMGEDVPTNIMRMSVFSIISQVQEVSIVNMKKSLTRLGIKLPDHIFSLNPWVFKRNIDKFLVSVILKKFSGSEAGQVADGASSQSATMVKSLVGKIPTFVFESKSVFELKRNMEKFLKNYAYAKLGTYLAATADPQSISLTSYLKVIHLMITDQVKKAFPAIQKMQDALGGLKGLRTLAKEVADMQMQATRAGKVLSKEHLEKIQVKVLALQEVGYPAAFEYFLPAGITLPTVEELKASPAKAMEQALATVKNANIEQFVRKELKRLMAQAIEMLQKLRELMSTVPSAADIKAMSKDQMNSYLEKLQPYMDMLQGMMPANVGFTLPSVKEAALMSQDQLQNVMSKVSDMFVIVQEKLSMIPWEVLDFSKYMKQFGDYTAVIDKGRGALKHVEDGFRMALYRVAGAVGLEMEKEDMEDMTVLELLRACFFAAVSMLQAKAAPAIEKGMAMAGQLQERGMAAMGQGMELAQAKLEQAKPLAAGASAAAAAGAVSASAAITAGASSASAAITAGAAEASAKGSEIMAAAPGAMLDVKDQIAKQVAELRAGGVEGLRQQVPSLQVIKDTVLSFMKGLLTWMQGKVREMAEKFGVTIPDLAAIKSALAQLPTSTSAALAMPREKLVDLLGKLGYPGIFQTLLPSTSIEFPSLEELKTMGKEKLTELWNKLVAMLEKVGVTKEGFLALLPASMRLPDLAEMKSLLSSLPTSPAAAADMSRERLVAALTMLGYPGTLQAILPTKLDLPPLEELKEMGKERLMELWGKLMEQVNKARESLGPLVAQGQEGFAALIPPNMLAGGFPGWSELMKFKEMLEIAIKSRVSSMLAASGLPIGDLMKKLSISQLIDAVKDLIKKFDMSSMSKTMLDNATAVLKQLPSAEDMQTRGAEKLQAMVNDEDLKAKIGKFLPAPILNLIPWGQALSDTTAARYLGTVTRVFDMLRAMLVDNVTKGVEQMKKLKAVLTNLPSPSEVSSMSREKLTELLEYIGYPDSLKAIMPSGMEIPALEELKEMSKEQLQAAWGKIMTIPAIGGSMAAKLPSPSEAVAMSRDKLTKALAAAGYPYSFQAVLPKEFKLPTLDSVKTMSNEELRELLERVKEQAKSARGIIDQYMQRALASMTSAGLKLKNYSIGLLMALSNFKVPAAADLQAMSKEQLTKTLELLGDPKVVMDALGDVGTKVESWQQVAADPELVQKVLGKISGSPLLGMARRAMSALPVDFRVGLARLQQVGLDKMPSVELRGILESMGWPDRVQGLLGEGTVLPTIEEILEDRMRLVSTMKSMSVGLMSGMQASAMAKVKEGMEMMKQFVGSPLMSFNDMYNTLMTRVIPKLMAMLGLQDMEAVLAKARQMGGNVSLSKLKDMGQKALSGASAAASSSSSADGDLLAKVMAGGASALEAAEFYGGMVLDGVKQLFRMLLDSVKMLKDAGFIPEWMVGAYEAAISLEFKNLHENAPESVKRMLGQSNALLASGQSFMRAVTGEVDEKAEAAAKIQASFREFRQSKFGMSPMPTPKSAVASPHTEPPRPAPMAPLPRTVEGLPSAETDPEIRTGASLDMTTSKQEVIEVESVKTDEGETSLSNLSIGGEGADDGVMQEVERSITPVVGPQFNNRVHPAP